jgi:site-specific recombinase XerD
LRHPRGTRAALTRRFLAEEASYRSAPSSQARTVAALKCFSRLCVESEYLDRDPAHVLSTPKKREALPDVRDRGELRRMLAVPERPGCGSIVPIGDLWRILRADSLSWR